MKKKKRMKNRLWLSDKIDFSTPRTDPRKTIRETAIESSPVN